MRFESKSDAAQGPKNFVKALKKIDLNPEIYIWALATELVRRRVEEEVKKPDYDIEQDAKNVGLTPDQCVVDALIHPRLMEKIAERLDPNEALSNKDKQWLETTCSGVAENLNKAICVINGNQNYKWAISNEQNKMTLVATCIRAYEYSRGKEEFLRKKKKEHDAEKGEIDTLQKFVDSSGLLAEKRREILRDLLSQAKKEIRTFSIALTDKFIVTPRRAVTSKSRKDYYRAVLLETCIFDWKDKKKVSLAKVYDLMASLLNGLLPDETWDSANIYKQVRKGRSIGLKNYMEKKATQQREEPKYFNFEKSEYFKKTVERVRSLLSPHIW